MQISKTCTTMTLINLSAFRQTVKSVFFFLVFFHLSDTTNDNNDDDILRIILSYNLKRIHPTTYRDAISDTNARLPMMAHIHH